MADAPVLLTVDDDPAVSRAIARDLRQRHGRDYRVQSSPGDTRFQVRLPLTSRGPGS